MKNETIHLSIPNCPADLSAWIEAEGIANRRAKANQAVVLMEFARDRILEERKQSPAGRNRGTDELRTPLPAAKTRPAS